MKTNYLEFRTFLHNEFLKRIQKNPSYSLRAYAKFLGINDSTLSKILSGNLKITSKRFEDLASRFNLTLKQIKSFDSEKTHSLNEEQFVILSEWYFFAILELIKTKNFSKSPLWISKRLGISQNEAKIALLKLKAQSFIEEDEKGQVKLIQANNQWNSDNDLFLKKAHRNFQEQIIKKSLDTLNVVPSSEKENSSLTVACDKTLIPEVKERINKFKQELDEFIMSHGEHSDVYQLSISFFPLTQDIQENYV